MKHLFVINPVAYNVRHNLKGLRKSIELFFEDYPDVSYEIHETRWMRDAFAVIKRSAMDADELLRVHLMGGTGLVCEAVNGLADMPNTQLAVYPYGRDNSFLRYFGDANLHSFSSIRSQVFSDAIPIDAIRCGGNYGILYGMVGLEASVSRDGINVLMNSNQNLDFLKDFAYIWMAVQTAFSNKVLSQNYWVDIDGEILDGKYTTILISNGPCYGKKMTPALEAHPNDGFFDVYLMKDFPRRKLLSVAGKYLAGDYQKLKGLVTHHVCRKLTISSDHMMCLSVDELIFYEKSVTYEVMPHAIDFVCPGGINVEKLPRIFAKSGR